VPVLSGEEQDTGRWSTIFRVRQTPKRVLLLLPETRASIWSDSRPRRCRPPRQGSTVAVRGPSEPCHTRRQWSVVVGCRRVEIFQLGFTPGPATRGRPPSDAKDHAQGARSGIGVR